MLSNLFNNLTASIYRRTEDAKHVKSWTLLWTCKGKLSSPMLSTTIDWQTGIRWYNFYTSYEIIIWDKLTIESKNYVVWDVRRYKSMFEKYYLCILSTADGN